MHILVRLFILRLINILQYTRIYDQGHEVVGLDGVEKPILEFFQEQGIAYTTGNDGGLKFFAAS